MKTKITKFIKNESGATAIEYGLIITLIVAAIVLAIGLLGQENAQLHKNIAQKVEESVDKVTGTLD